MKTLFFFFCVLLGTLRADDLKSSMNGFELAKRLDVTGNVFQGESKAVSFRTEDVGKIQKIINWLRAIPTRPMGRVDGNLGKVSAREELIFDLTLGDNTHHVINIFGRVELVLDNDRIFRADDVVDVEPLFKIVGNIPLEK